MNIGGFLVSRPGVEQVKALSTPATPRGLFTYNGELWGVWGTKLYQGASMTEVGTIRGSAAVNTASGFNQCAIAASGGNYQISSSNVFNEITDSDLPTCRDVARIDGRFVWVPVDGSPLAYSDVGSAGSVGPLAFFDAETLPDVNVGVDNIKNDLFVFGADSIERFRNLGTEDAPFVRVNNSIVEVGLVGGKIKTKDSVMFLGQDRDNGYAFYLFNAGTAQVISPPTINEALNLDYDPEQLEACVAQRFNWRGADCYVFSLYNRAFLFQGGKWSYLDSGIDDAHKLYAWDVKHATLHDGVWYAQDRNGLVKLTTANADYGSEFARRVRTYGRAGDESVFSIGGMELVIAQGESYNSGDVGLSVSKNGKLWSPFFYRSVANIGGYDKRLRFQRAGGLGRYDGYIGITLYCTDDIEFAVDNIGLL